MKSNLINIAYLRCSKDEQDVSHQQSSIEKFCAHHNIIIDKIIKDEGVSAYSKSAYERQGLSEVIHLAETDKLNKLIVFETSRLSRNFHEGQSIIKFFTDKKIEIYSVVDGGQINATELDDLLNSIRYWLNQKSSKETSDRIKSQKKMARLNGEYLGHPVLLGFKIEGKYEIVDEDKREFIEELFDTYISYGSKACIGLLKGIGVNANHQTLMQRLKNEKYVQIIGADKFKQVQKTIESRRCMKNSNTRSLNRSEILYEGLLYHSCGNKLSIDKNRKGEPVFRCKKCKGNSEIKIKKSFTGPALINNLNIEITQVIDGLDKAILEKKYNSRSNKKQSVITFRIHELNILLKEKKKSLGLANNKLERLLISDSMDESTLKIIAGTIDKIKIEIHDIEAELKDRENDLNIIEEQSKIEQSTIEKIMNIKKIYNGADNNKKKAILNMLVKNIMVRDIEDFDIYLNI